MLAKRYERMECEVLEAGERDAFRQQRDAGEVEERAAEEGEHDQLDQHCEKKRKGKRKRSKMEVAEKQGQQASRRLDRGTKGGRRRTEDTKLEDRHRRLDLGARSLRPPSLRLEEPPQQRAHNAVPNPDRNDPVRERVAWQNHQKDQTRKEGKTKDNSPEENSKRPRSSAVSHHAGSPTRPCQTTLLDLPTSANASPTVLFASRSTAHSGTEMSAALVVKYSGSVKLDVKMFK